MDQSIVSRFQISLSSEWLSHNNNNTNNKNKNNNYNYNNNNHNNNDNNNGYNLVAFKGTFSLLVGPSGRGLTTQTLEVNNNSI